MRMPRRSGISRPGSNVRKKKEGNPIKTSVSGSSIKIGMTSPELKITQRRDGKETVAFDIGKHHFGDTR